MRKDPPRISGAGPFLLEASDDGSACARPAGGLDAGAPRLPSIRVRPCHRPTGRWLGLRPTGAHFIVGIENSAPSFRPDGQREVTVLVRV